MVDGPLSETCLCGGTEFHKLAHSTVAWCRRCGALYIVYAGRWQIPLDRANEVRPSDLPEEEPTRPDLPGVAKKAR